VGKAEVREIFKIPRVGIVAGCYVSEGKVVKGVKVKVKRKEELVGEGKIVSLKRFDQDVNEINTGLECGIKVDGVDDIHRGDIIEVYELKRVR